jgi:hypothetical protein
MMMVGENEEEYVNNVITGAVVGLRMKQDRVCLWCAPTKKPEAILKAGCVLTATMFLTHHFIHHCSEFSVFLLPYEITLKKTSFCVGASVSI